MHVVEDALRLGKLLSCFVAERKHRQTKRSALFTFRSIDNSVAKDLLHRQCEAVINHGDILYSRQRLVSPACVSILGVQYKYSKHAVLSCGSLRFDDIVWLKSGTIGKIVRFWSHGSPDSKVAQVRFYTPVNDALTRWSTAAPRVGFVDVSDILDAVIWGAVAADDIRVIVPCRALV